VFVERKSRREVWGGGETDRFYAGLRNDEYGSLDTQKAVGSTLQKRIFYIIADMSSYFFLLSLSLSLFFFLSLSLSLSLRESHHASITR